MHLTRTSDSATFALRDWSLSTDLNSLRWSLDCRLAEESEFDALLETEEVEVTVAGVTIALLVTTKGKTWSVLASGKVAPDLALTAESASEYTQGVAAAVSVTGYIRKASFAPDGLRTLEVPYALVAGKVPGDQISCTFRGQTITDYYITGMRVGPDRIEQFCTLTVSADLPDIDFQVVFDPYTTRGFSGWDIYHFPGFLTQARDLAATVGTVAWDDTNYSSQYDFQYTEYVVFRGSREANGRYPALSIASFVVEYAIDENLEDVSAKVSLYVQAGRIRSNMSMYGYAKVVYNTTYSVLRYTGVPDQLPPAVTFIYEFGTILSRRKKSIATYDVQQITVDYKGYVPLYKVYTVYIADGDGAYETPANWPAELNYSISGPNPAPAQGECSEHERLHERGYVHDGFFKPEEHTAGGWLEPYLGYTGLPPDIEYIYEQESAPSDADKLEIYNNQDWDEIKEYLKDKYPGIQDTGGTPL